jgi:two-component system OmpR family response regulator
VADATLRCGKLELDTRTSRVSCENEVISLTSHEFKILSYLMHHLDEVVSRTDLTEHIYAQDFDRDSNTIEVMIGRLRKKLPEGLIQTVRGMGYRMSKVDC